MEEGNTNDMHKGESVVVLANGKFPESDIPLGYLNAADIIICCDGAVEKLNIFGLEPSVIVGDMDSILPEHAKRYADIIIPDKEDQDSNDLTKAIKYCISKDINDVVILGATGLREDHTIGNIFLLLEYSDFLNVKAVSDYGIFLTVSSGDKISSFPGQQTSIFTNKPEIELSSVGLRYSLDKSRLANLWMGTLNECLYDSFSLDFNSDRIIVFLEF